MMRRFFGGLALISMAAGLGNASTIVYYSNIFYPSANATYSTAGAALSSAQLQTAASGASLYSTASPTGFSATVVLPQFDRTIVGDPLHVNTLDSVQLAIGWAQNGSIVVTNTTGSTQSFTNATSTVPLTIGGPASLTFITNAVAGPYSGTVNGTSPSYSTIDLSYLSPANQVTTCGLLGGTLTGSSCSYQTGTTNGTTTVGGSLVTGSATSALLTSGLAQYQGFGSTNLNFSVNAGTGIFSGSSVQGVSFGGTSSAGGTLEVIYNYHSQPIPEPVTMSLVGGALVGLAVFSRRRMNKA